MKMLLLVLAGLCGAAWGSQWEGCCTAGDRAKVLAAWSSVWSAENSNNRVTIAKAVFEDLFAHDESAKNLFKAVGVDDINSPEFGAHCVRVMGGLDISINLLHDKEALDAELAHLSVQHQERDGITAAYFDAIGDSFLRVLPKAIDNFNPDPWWCCYNVIKAGIAHGLP